MWQIVDWFLIMGATRRCNLAAAQQIRDSLVQLRPSTDGSATVGVGKD